MCTFRKPVPVMALVFFLEIILVVGTSSYQGYSSSGNGKLAVSSYSEYNQQLCQPSAISFGELSSFGKAEVVQFNCPEGYQITGVQYTTDSLEQFVTGIRLICNDGVSFFHMGSERFSGKDLTESYLGGGINEVAFGYDAEVPVLRLIQVVSEEALPKGSERVLSFISHSEQLFRSQTFVGSVPVSACGVILRDSPLKAPVIGNVRIGFSDIRPLAHLRYRGLAYTGVPKIEFSKPDAKRCSQVVGVSPSSTRDLNFHIKCPSGHRIIGVDVVTGDKITAASVENQLIHLGQRSSTPKPGPKENMDQDTPTSDPFVDSLGSLRERSASAGGTGDKENGVDSSVDNREIIMLRFLCSDYISSFSIGQALKNVTSWNLQDQIPNMKDWELSQILVSDEAEKTMRDAAEGKLVLSTSEVSLGNINYAMVGFTTEKLLIKAYMEDGKPGQKGGELSDYVERYTLGPVLLNVNEFVDHNLNMRNILKSLPEIYKSNPINKRSSFSGDEFEGVCGRVMYGSMLISGIGFEVSKSIKPYFPQIITTSNVKIEKDTGRGFGCDKMLRVSPTSGQDAKLGKESRSSLRSFQGSVECPPGLAVERIHLMVSKASGILLSIKFDCGNNLENYFIIGKAKQLEAELKYQSRDEAAKGKELKIISTSLPSTGNSYNEIVSISVSPSEHLRLNSVLVPEASLPISMFQVIQKSDSSPSQQESTARSGLNYVSERYPPNLQRKITWSNGVLTKVCADVTAGGIIRNIGFGFKYPFQPTSRKEISGYYGFSSEGDGKLDVDSKEFACPGMLHSPRAQLLFRKQTEEIIMTGELRSRSKKTLLRSINFMCPEKSVINRVEVTWQTIRGAESLERSGREAGSAGGRGPLGSIGAMRFFCSDGKSVFKVGSDATPTHSKSNLEAHEVLLGYKDLSGDEIAAVRRELTKESSIKITEELLRSLPGDPSVFKLVHESRPLSKVQLEVEGARSYGSAVEALNSLRRRRPGTYKSRIWKGGHWTGVCIGLLNLGGGIIKSHEFSIVSFGSYFEKPPPLAILPYKGFLQTGIPQVHENKIVSTCDMTTSPSFGLKYPGFSAAFLCPNGTHIERIGYSTLENHSKQGFEIFTNGTLSLPHPFREQKHVGPLGQITAIQLFCSDGISTVTIGQPSKSVSISKPGEIGEIRVGFVKPNSGLLDKNVSASTLLMPASIELISKSRRRHLIRYSNPNFPSYTQKISTWEGEDLQAVCVDFAVIEEKRGSNKSSSYLRWAGTVIRYPEKYLIMSIGFAFKRRTASRSRGTSTAPAKIKVAENIPKLKLQANKSAGSTSHHRRKT